MTADNHHVHASSSESHPDTGDQETTTKGPEVTQTSR
jgi:hypothetical protein